MTKQESEARARVACDLWVERMKRDRAGSSLGNATVYEGPEGNRQLFCEVVGSFIAAAVAEEREACARLVEAGLEDDDAGLSDEICRRDVDLAAAIRKRGQQ